MKKQVISRTLLAMALSCLTACGGCGKVANAGEECEPDRGREACVEGYSCLASGDTYVCSIPVGESCDLVGTDDYCEYGSSCVSVDGGGRCLYDRASGCDLDAAEDLCAPGLMCSPVQGGEPACFESVVLEGMVLDATDRAPIEGAQVIALDDVASAVSDVAETDVAGYYELPVLALRDAEGKPVEQYYTLRVGARDYQTFPGGLRTALPIDLSTATKDDDSGVYRVNNALTEVLLIPLPESEQGRSTIYGRVIAPGQEAGVLVVAEVDGKGYSALSDKQGYFSVFNVPDGSAEVQGYKAELQLDAEQVSVSGEDVVDVELSESDQTTTDMSGTVDIVNAPGGSLTSVVLVVESTFNENFVRGEVPIGLRAPREGEPSISKQWSISGVPAGDYVVLAAFENDNLVRDPDTNIAGTSIVRVSVEAGTASLDLSDSFKITEALEVISPGADEAEAVTEKPMLRWVDDSSEDYYELEVYNAYGELVWESTIPGSQSDLSVAYEGPLEDGMYYQFRASSWRAPGGKNAAPISSTEDLKGVFYKPAP